MSIKSIFLSSTAKELKQYRELVYAAINEMDDYRCVRMENFGARDFMADDFCRAKVVECDLFIGIVGHFFGNSPEGSKQSFTQREYVAAVEADKPRLMFIAPDDFSLPANLIEPDEQRRKQKEFRDRVKSDRIVAEFSSPEKLALQVVQAIRNWEKKPGDIPEFHREAYFKALRVRYQRIDLEGLTPSQHEDYQEWLMHSVFVEQSVREGPPLFELSKEMCEQLRRKKEIPPDELPEGVTIADQRRVREVYEKPVRPVLEVLTDPQHQHVVILGDPGSGKSTLSRYILLSLIEPAGDEKLRRAFDGYLPLLIELRRYVGQYADKKCNTFLEFLGQTEGWHLNAARLHDYLTNDGRAVVIFDGLDEIFDPEHREHIMHHIVAFALDYPKARIVATSRPTDYRRKILTNADFSHFTLQDLDESQVATFAERWYGLALTGQPKDARERRERILRAFRESPSIRQLAGNPMLLTIMAIIAKDEDLPRERRKLYDYAANTLINRWDLTKPLKDQSVQTVWIRERDKKELLEGLAYQMQTGTDRHAGNYIYDEELQNKFEEFLKEHYLLPAYQAPMIAIAMIEQLRTRNFILSFYGANQYGFVHRAFLEYFCASAFVNRLMKTKQITLDELKRDVYGAHWKDRQWQEVLSLICSMIDERFTSEIINHLIAEASQPRPEEYEERLPWNIALAVHCLSELQNPHFDAESAKRLLEAVCALFDVRLKKRNLYDKFLKEEIAASAEAIGRNWPYRTLLADYLRKHPSFQNSWDCVSAFGRFIGAVGSGLDEVLEIIKGYAMHRHWKRRFLAVHALPKGWPNDLHTFNLLRERTMKDRAWRIRIEAVNAIASYYRDDEQTLPLLREWIDKAEDSDVRIMAVSLMGVYYKNDEQTLPLLCECSAKHTDLAVRSTALRAIVEHYHDEAETLPRLRDWAVSATYSDVRGAALVAIVEHYREDEQTLPLLRNRALHDQSWKVRKVALKAVIQHYRGDKRTPSLIRDRAVKDDWYNVRSVALQAIVEHYHDEAGMLRRLRNWAVNAAYSDVRSAALGAMVEHYRNDNQTLPLLRDWAVNAAYSDVRSAALRAMVEHYRNDKQTLTLLRNRIVQGSNNDVRSAALMAIVEHYREDEQTLPLLRNRALHDKSWIIRSVALGAIMKHYQKDEQTLSLLRDWAVSAKYSDVRSAALRAMVEHYRNDKQTLPLLRNRIVQDSNSDVRSAALRAIAEHYRNDKRTLPLLRNHVVQDSNSDVRGAALMAIVEHYREDEQTLPLLRNCVIQDSNGNVRSAALKAIIEHYRSHKRVLLLLHDWAANAKYNDIRKATLKAIVKHYRNDKRTLSLLHDRAVQDGDSDIRYTALLVIARFYGDDKETPLRLRESAKNDPANWLRDTAKRLMVELIAKT